MATSQASQIRKVTLDLLKENTKSDLLTPLEDSNYRGIRYTNLKKYLQEKYSFTEGSVIGALQTITEKEVHIHKIKNKQGTFFYYDTQDKYTNDTDILALSPDFKLLIKKSHEIESLVSKILVNIARENYSDITDFDKTSMRNIYATSNKLYQEIKYHEDKELLIGLNRIF